MSEQYCLRCKTVPLVKLEPLDPQITFFECPACRRHYALEPGKQLAFRWRHPINLVLYGVIFDDAPSEKAADVAALVIKQRSSEELALFVREIRLELDDPTQQVRDILECRASEAELRNYLRLFCEHVEQFLAERL